MGRACSKDGREKRCIDGKIIFKWIFKKWELGHGLD